MTGILAIDQGTTSSRAIYFDNDLKPRASHGQEFSQIYPKNGWVEHDPEEIWRSVVHSCQCVIDKVGEFPSAIGITNQRETVIVWDRETGRPLGNAIVWQDRRTAEECARLKKEGFEATVTKRTGLLLDPYFSASKLAWILQNIAGATERASRGELCFGTVDSYLIWRLTHGRSHVTDLTNACRTLLVNIDSGQWDNELLKKFGIPRAMLPEIKDSADQFGEADSSIFGKKIPILGVAGDQQAAAVGQACFQPGMLKSTYGTGCFALLNTGLERCDSSHRLLTTVAYRLMGKTHYALEGSIFVAGAVVQWLRDALGLIEQASEAEQLAAHADLEQQIFIVPAFTGLGAPYWDAHCRGAVFGLTRNSGVKELARAALESVAYQTRDLLEAMKSDLPNIDKAIVLRVDGGMSTSDFTMQNLSNQLGVPVDRPKITETTALGAAYLAGLQLGIYPDPIDFSKRWSLERRFEPQTSAKLEAQKYMGWKDAVRRTLTSFDDGI